MGLITKFFHSGLAFILIIVFLLSSFSLMTASANSSTSYHYGYTISSVLGDNGGVASSITTDKNSNIIIAGISSGGLPTLKADNATYGGGSIDGFITKFFENGSLQFSTYLGGIGDDRIEDIAVDGSGNIYVCGSTTSPDFETKNAYNDTFSGVTDAFIAKYNPTGVLLFSTFIGGSSSESAFSIAVDGNENMYIGGITSSVDFPILTAWNGTYGGNGDAFIAKLDKNGVLLFSTFVGGSLNDIFYDIKVTSQGDIIACGATTSYNWPVTSDALDSSKIGGEDAIISRFNSTGSLSYSTYIGGTSLDSFSNIAIDSADNYYVTGLTFSSDYPTTSDAINTKLNGYDDAIYSKFNSSNSLVYSTYFGTTTEDSGTGISVDSNGNTYISGYTTETTFIGSNVKKTTLPLVQPVSSYNGAMDGFIVKFNSTGVITFSTYIGGSGNDFCYDIFVDPTNQIIYTSGNTQSSDFPLVDSYSNNVAGGPAFFMEISLQLNSLTFTPTTTLSSSVTVTTSNVPTSPGYIVITTIFGIVGGVLYNRKRRLK